METLFDSNSFFNPSAGMTKLLAIKYSRGKLELLDQRSLPFESHYIAIDTPQQAYDAIKDMVVRGAPAIGCAAALAVAAWLEAKGCGSQYASVAEATSAIEEAITHVVERWHMRLLMLHHERSTQHGRLNT